LIAPDGDVLSVRDDIVVPDEFSSVQTPQHALDPDMVPLM
jgi:hypothetical protein